MAKIYNEIVIDMNPESPTFEETLFEDSFEYSGDMMLMRNGGGGGSRDETRTQPSGGIDEGTKIAVINETDNRYHLYIWTDGKWDDTETLPYGATPNAPYKIHSSLEDATKNLSTTTTAWGAPNLTKEDFLDENNDPLPIDTVVANLKVKFPKSDPAELRKLVLKEAPQFQAVSDEEKGFVTETADIKREEIAAQYGEEGTEGWAAAERDLEYQKAEDVYGLGVSAVGRKREAAGMGLETGLGALQKGAGQLGAQMRGAYGGMGGGMRGAIGGQAALAKGAEQAYGKYGLEMGAAEDQMTKLRQGIGYAGTAKTIAETKGLSAWDIAQRRAGLTEREGIYDLGQTAYDKYEGQLSDFVDTEQFKMKRGGRVPSKQTFLDILTKLPDAGGS